MSPVRDFLIALVTVTVSFCGFYYLFGWLQ
jgi:hypothetical protein